MIQNFYFFQSQKKKTKGVMKFKKKKFEKIKRQQKK